MTNTDDAPVVTLAAGAKIQFPTSNRCESLVVDPSKFTVFMWCRNNRSVQRIALFSVPPGAFAVQTWGGPLVEGPWGHSFPVGPHSVVASVPSTLTVFLVEGALVELGGITYEVRDDLPNSWPRLVAI